MSEVISYYPATIATEEARGVARLLQKVWPHAVHEVSALAETFAKARPEQPDFRIYAIWDDDGVIATAQTFSRTIHFAEQSLPVLALAGVCVDPVCRGRGLGELIVRAALKPVDAGDYAISLYQTGVPEFYRKLGAREVDNAFTDRGAFDLQQSPWWEPHIMIYPAGFDWPDVPIDLNGPGF